MADELLSIGIDIGTSTTQVIFSRLSIENTSGYFSVPQIRIVDKQVIYKGEVYSTPLKTRTMIDADAVAILVEGEFKRAGFTPRDTRTGAVIITGETARKDNAALVLCRGFRGLHGRTGSGIHHCGKGQRGPAVFGGPLLCGCQHRYRRGDFQSGSL